VDLEPIRIEAVLLLVLLAPKVPPSTHENSFVLLHGDHRIRLQQEYPVAG
jgi:hypothetical protein